MKLPRLLEPAKLNEILSHIHKSAALPPIKLLDCTYSSSPPVNYKIFKDEYYGMFEKLHTKMSTHKFRYLREHIPGAIFFDIDAAFHPSKSERFTMYEPKIFERYARFLGLNSDDHLIFYGRGTSLAAMIFAARVYWLFKSYGHESLSVLNGGFDCWKKSGFDIESSQEFPKLSTGNWAAKDMAELYNIRFESLFGEAGGEISQNLEKIDVLDSRPSEQYNGEVETGLDPYFVEGSHIPKTKNVSVAQLISNDGRLKSESEILKELEKADLSKTRSTVTMCNTGMQASLLSFTLDTLSPSISTKLYSGSLFEVSRLAPKLINGGKC